MLFPKTIRIVNSVVINLIIRVKFRKRIRLDGFLWVEGTILLKLESTKKPSLYIGKNCKFLGSVELRTRDGAMLVIGNEVNIDGPARFVAAGKNSFIRISDRCKFTPYSIVNGGGNVEIGSGSVFGPRFTLNANQHIFSTGRRIIESGFEHIDISIGENVWSGSDVSVIPGARIDSDAVLGANSVVNSSIERGEIFAGSPARKIGEVGKNRKNMKTRKGN